MSAAVERDGPDKDGSSTGSVCFSGTSLSLDYTCLSVFEMTVHPAD